MNIIQDIEFFLASGCQAARGNHTFAICNIVFRQSNKTRLISMVVVSLLYNFL